MRGLEGATVAAKYRPTRRRGWPRRRHNTPLDLQPRRRFAILEGLTIPHWAIAMISPPRFDQNLLLGVLARKMEFISREQLTNAVRAWSRDPAAPLGKILVEQGALTPARRHLLEPIVDEHVRQHGGQVAGNLAQLESWGVTAEELGLPGDSAMTLSMAQVSVSTAPPSGAFGGPQAPVIGTTSRGRFRILRRHAAGGLGEVFVAQDIELNRPVALKQIQSRFAGDAQSRSRFVVEAEVTGGLEHPGIVPVYGLGADDDGRPYYAMRLIRGVSLLDAIRQFHQSDERQDRDPSERSLALRELLTRFVSVCMAIEYAHSRSVLHRDLKPSNIMLGKFGETLVVDWGLAKPLGQPIGGPIASETPLVPLSAGDSSLTLLGEAVGTPAFMSPEQAAGRVAEIGAASDVYGLAATLYMLLTGKPPFERDADLRSVLERVKTGTFPRPSAVNRLVPPALEAICLKGMSLRAEERYASPQQLAHEIEHWLADEPVAAYQEPLSARLRRWAKRHRTLVGVALASLLTAVIGLAAGLVAVRFEQQRTEAAWKEEGIRRREADEQRALAERSQQLMVEFFRSPNPELDGSKITVAEVLDRAVDSLLNDKKIEPKLLIGLLTTIGNTYSGLGLPERAVPLLEKARDLSRRVFGVNSDQQFATESIYGATLLDAGRVSEAVKASEALLSEARRKYGRESVETARQMNNLAVAYKAADRRLEAQELLEEAYRIHLDELGSENVETLNCLSSLATVYLELKHVDLAMELFEEAVDTSTRLTGPDSTNTLIAMSNLAATYSDANRFGEAEDLMKKTIDLHIKRYGEEHSATLICRENLGKMYHDAGRYPEALVILEEIYPKFQAMRGDSHPETVITAVNLAESLWEVGRGHEATKLLENTLAKIREPLGPRHHLTLSTMGNLGLAYLDSGQPQEALTIFNELVELRTELLGPRDRATLSARHNIALCYVDLDRMAQAIDIFEDAYELSLEEFGADDEDTLMNQENLAVAYQRAGRVGEAIPLLVDVNGRMRSTLGEDDFDTLRSALDLGRCYVLEKQYDKAETVLREAQLAWQRKDAEDWHLFAIGSLLGAALDGLHRDAEAETLLISSAEGLQARADRIPPALRDRYLTSSIDRIIAFYEAREQTEPAAAWRKKLESIETAATNDGH